MFSDPAAIFKFLVELGIFIGVYYYLLKFFQGTRAAQTLTGLLLGFGALWALSSLLDLGTLTWALRQLSLWLVLGMLIIFAPEIRRALAGLGLRGWTTEKTMSADSELVEHVVTAVSSLAERKIGALIAIERDIGLRAYREKGVQLDSSVDPQLLASIFYPQAPLHDGGVIIAGNRIAAASCVFPLSEQDMSRGLGTRHRAAKGLSDESDAIIVVVSEETGTISLAYKGKLSRGLDDERLRRLMSTLMIKRAKKKKPGNEAGKKTQSGTGNNAEAASAAPEPVESDVIDEMFEEESA